MLTQLGKMLRIIRINTGDSMRTMAKKLDYSVSYLSAIENGKRTVPDDLQKKIENKYSSVMTNIDKRNLRDAINNMRKGVNITELSAEKKKIVFAVTQEQLDEDTIQELCAIIEKKKSKK